LHHLLRGLLAGVLHILHGLLVSHLRILHGLLRGHHSGVLAVCYSAAKGKY
jgi:hypothetical protein